VLLGGCVVGAFEVGAVVAVLGAAGAGVAVVCDVLRGAAAVAVDVASAGVADGVAGGTGVEFCDPPACDVA